MKKLLCSFLVLFLGSAILIACAGDKEPEAAKEAAEKTGESVPGSHLIAPEKGALEKMRDKAAQDALDRIRTPLDKARSTAEQGQDRLSRVKAAAEAK